MRKEEHSSRLKRQHHHRIRIVKRILRWLPRRANVHRYPVLKWFPNAARRRAYLWSFKTAEVTPALYAGWILSLLPLYGMQFLLAILAAFVLRANLPFLIGLQSLTNPLTIGPTYFVTYQFGRVLLSTVGLDLPHDDTPELPGFPEFRLSFYQHFARFFIAAGIGGVILGLVAAFISDMSYRAWVRARKSRSTPIPDKRVSLPKRVSD